MTEEANRFVRVRSSSVILIRIEYENSERVESFR